MVIETSTVVESLISSSLTTSKPEYMMEIVYTDVRAAQLDFQVLNSKRGSEFDSFLHSSRPLPLLPSSSQSTTRTANSQQQHDADQPGMPLQAEKLV